MNKNVMIDAISAIDQKYIIEYVQYETKLSIIKSRKRRNMRSLIICAACLALVFSLLLVSLPLSFIVLGSEPVQEWKNQVIENVLFPLDHQLEDPDDDVPPAESLLQLNWVDWKITGEMFYALGAGTDDSVIDKLQSVQSDGVVGQRLQNLGDFLKRLYDYYLQHKKEIDSALDKDPNKNENAPKQTVALDGCTYQFNNYWQYYELEEVYHLAADKLGVLHIPDQVEGYPVGQINREACKGLKNLTKLVMPDTVTSIGLYAFNHCENLAEIEFSDQLKSIGGSAFAGCHALTRIDLPDSVNDIGESAFANCQGLEYVTLPTNLEVIPENGFAGCKRLSWVSVGDSLVTIKGYAFSGCESLEGIALPQSLRTIEQNAFESSGLKTIEIPYGTTKIGDNAFLNCMQLRTVEFPETLTEIGTSAFLGSSVLSIFIPKCELKIGMHAFDSVLSVEYGGTVKDWCNYITSDFLAFGNGMLVQCTNGQCYADYSESLSCTYTGDSYSSYNVSAGYAVTHSEEHKDDAWIIIPPYLDSSDKRVVGISYGAFANCESLEKIYMADAVAIIESDAFLGCKSLYEVRLSQSLVAINLRAFQNCPLLQTISIPVSVKMIDSLAFSECTQLKYVEYQGTMEQWEQIDLAQNAFEKGVTIRCTDGEIIIN